MHGFELLGAHLGENHRRLVGGLDKSARDVPRRGEVQGGVNRIKMAVVSSFSWPTHLANSNDSPLARRVHESGKVGGL